MAELQAGGFLPEPGAVNPIAQEQPDFFHQAPRWHEETVGRRYELTEAQREIWLGSQVSAEASSAFNEPFTLHLRGALDEAVMRQAIQAVMARHEALHMRFSPDGDYQTPTAPAPMDVPLLDLVPAGGVLSEQEKVDAVTKIMAAGEWAAAPFDLLNGRWMA
ncbi:MAG: condensation domain-containing protein [Caldilineaceae bacterium]